MPSVAIDNLISTRILFVKVLPVGSKMSPFAFLQESGAERILSFSVNGWIKVDDVLRKLFGLFYHR